MALLDVLVVYGAALPSKVYGVCEGGPANAAVCCSAVQSQNSGWKSAPTPPALVIPHL